MITNFELFNEGLFYKHKSGQNYTHDEVKNIKFDKIDTLEDNIKFSIKWFPTLYYGKEARERVLSHIFLSIGTEYDWDDTTGKKISYDENCDDDMLKYRLKEYNSEYRKKERLKEIEYYKKSLKDYEELLSLEKDNKNYNYYKEKIDEYRNSLNKLIEFDKKFNPFYIEHDVKDEPIQKIPWSASMDLINDIPDNVNLEYLNGMYEIISFYCQSRFRNDKQYKMCHEMKSKLKKRFKNLLD